MGRECVTVDDQAELVDPRRDIQNQSCCTAPSITHTHTDVCVQLGAAAKPFLQQLKVRLLQSFAADVALWSFTDRSRSPGRISTTV